ncbi:DUF7557 family protein [Natronomonas sp.]
MSRNSSIPVSDETRRRIKACKRAGETYDDLLTRMADHYEPPARPEGMP